MPILTDIHEREQCAIVAPVVDILQIPAFLSRQTDLLVAAAQTGKVVNVKKGQFLAPWDMKNAIAKITETGNLKRHGDGTRRQLRLQHAGRRHDRSADDGEVRRAGRHGRDPCGAEAGGQGDKSGGDREMAPYIARAAVAVGVAAVFMETHQDPEDAARRGISDAANMLWLRDVPGLLAELVEIDRIVKRPRVN